ncbi:MAG: ABC transporter ATP-binding protein/permease [Actinomycetia bacterium]|nr:ABC transporter ATP-binding protein/permease [Actinomycetes bacterium]
MSESTGHVLRRAFQIAPALSKGLWLTLALAVFGTGLQLVVPITVQRIIDSVLLSNEQVDTSSVVTSGLIALVAVAFAMWARRTSLARLARSSVTGLTDLRVTTFGYLHKLSMLHVQSERRGALVSRVTSDIETMQQFMEWGGVGMILGAAQILLAVMLMLVYEWRLALMITVGVLIYSVMLLWFQGILRRAHDSVRERVADSLSVVGEATAGLPTVRAFGMESVVMGKVSTALDRQYRAEYGAGALAAVLFSSAEIFAGVITASVIAVGVIFGVSWGLSAGTLVAFLFLVTLLVEPVQMLVETINQAQSAGAGLRKVLNLLDTPIEVADPVDGVSLPDRPLDLRFEEVRFRYPTGDDVLHNVTVSIAAGERVAVVGETGSGKTTFAKLATRLLDPADGSISIADVPINEVRFDSLRSRVSYVPQEGFLFEGTVADNVRYGKPDANDAGVRVAFADLGLLEWVDALTDGIDTRVGERGSNLSAGERQLVAIARAWIANPDLLVLDEATSAVDPAIEVQIRRAIERLTSGRTSITVAHRLSTAEASDTVLVLDAGRLVERGRHEDLVRAAGVYADLHRDWEGSVVE